MKNLNLFFFLATGVVLLAGCKKEEEVIPQNPSSDVMVKFSPNISVSSWGASDAIGVFMVESGSTAVADAAVNKKYGVEAAGASGVFSPAAPVRNNAIYFPSGSSSVNFIAYAPYRQDVTTLSFPVDVSGQNSPAVMDLLYAATVEGYSSATADPVPLRFAHQLTKLTLNVTAGEGIASSSLADLSAVIKGMNTAATFNLANGTLGDAGTTADITFYPVAAGQQYAAVVLPQTVAAGAVSIEFTAASTGFQTQWEVPAGAFAQNKEYRYAIVLRQNGVSVTVTTHDWEFGNTDLPFITLISPADGSTIDANDDADSFQFSWTPCEDATGYTLKISSSPEFPEGSATVGYTADADGHYDLTAEDFDALLEQMGVASGEPTASPLYWTVTPEPAGNILTQVYLFHAVRKSEFPFITLVSPVDGSTINANDGADSFPFSWTLCEEAASYTLKISSSPEFPEGTTVSTTVTDDHYDLAAADFDTLLEQMMGVAPGEQTTSPLYWTVIPDPAGNILTQIYSFHAVRKSVPVELDKSDWMVTVSTVYNNGFGEYMLDGDPTTSWYANGPATSWNSWAEIDMQEVKTITSIQIDCDYRIKNADFFAVEDKENGWGSPIAIQRKESNTGRFNWDIELETPITARYLRLTLNDSYWMGFHIIYDIYVRGYEQ
jgi:hypothetical protein